MSKHRKSVVNSIKHAPPRVCILLLKPCKQKLYSPVIYSRCTIRSLLAPPWVWRHLLLREMGGAPRILAPRNHFLVGIAKPSGCHSTDALGGKKHIVECRPLLRAPPPSPTCPWVCRAMPCGEWRWNVIGSPPRACFPLRRGGAANCPDHIARNTRRDAGGGATVSCPGAVAAWTPPIAGPRVAGAAGTGHHQGGPPRRPPTGRL